jgi:hypothetical protein
MAIQAIWMWELVEQLTNRISIGANSLFFGACLIKVGIERLWFKGQAG